MKEKKEFISKEPNDKERKNLLYALGLGLGFFILMILLSSMSANEEKRIISNYEKAFANTERNIVYIGRDTCYILSKYLNPILKDFKKDFGAEYVYIDFEKISSKAFEEILKDLDIDPETFGTPYIVALENGEVKERLIGFNGEQRTFEFFQRHNQISSDLSPVINYIKADEFVDLLNQSEMEVVVVGATTCSFCAKVRPTLIDLSRKHNLTINYYNINIVDGDDFQKAIETSLSLINSNIEAILTSNETKIENFGTPTMFLVKDRKVIAHLSGALSLSEFESFLEKNGVL
ncbi:MAG: thioredoxin family protein [Bacilli bacterium]|nr:thioredoxin family protein [Bacilli bacterium]